MSAPIRAPILEEVVDTPLIGAGVSVVSASITGAHNHLYVAHITTGDPGGAPAVSSIAGLGLSWVLVKAQCGGRDTLRTEVWYAIGGATTGVVTATLAASATESLIHVARWSGVDVATPIGASSKYNTNGVNGACSGGTDTNDATGSLTTTAANSVVVTTVSYDVGGSFTTTSGWIGVEINSVGDTFVATSIEKKTSPTAGAVTVGASNNLDGAYDWSLIAVEIIGTKAATAPFAEIGRIVWRDPAHGVTVVDEWINCSVTQDDYIGTCTLTFPVSAAWAAAAGIDPADDLIGNWLQIYYRDLTTPLWRGAAVKVEWGWSRGQKACQVTFEYMWAHLFRRCLAQSPTNVQFLWSGLTIKADEFAGRLMKHSIGVATAGGGLFAGTMYSLTVDRGDAGQFAPWVLTVVTPHSTSSVDMVIDQQSGANALDMLIDIGRRGDVAYTLVETSTPGTFEADVTATYQRSDVSAAVIISDRHGTMVGFQRTVDYTTVSNTWLIKGDGDGSGQTFTWYQDPSASTIGNFENTATAPNVTAAGSMAALKDRMMGLYAEAGQTVEVEIVEIGGVLFNDTFGWRDLVRVHSSEFSFAAAMPVVGYKLDIPSTGACKVSLTLGQHLHRLATDVRDWQPGQGGRGGGGIFYQRSG